MSLSELSPEIIVQICEYLDEDILSIFAVADTSWELRKVFEANSKAICIHYLSCKINCIEQAVELVDVQRSVPTPMAPYDPTEGVLDRTRLFVTNERMVQRALTIFVTQKKKELNRVFGHSNLTETECKDFIRAYYRLLAFRVQFDWFLDVDLFIDRCAGWCVLDFLQAIEVLDWSVSLRELEDFPGFSMYGLPEIHECRIWQGLWKVFTWVEYVAVQHDSSGLLVRRRAGFQSFGQFMFHTRYVHSMIGWGPRVGDVWQGWIQEVKEVLEVEQRHRVL